MTRNQRIAADYKLGETIAQLSSFYECSRRHILQVLQSEGVSLDRVPASHGNLAWTKSEDEELIARSDEGVSYSVIAASLGKTRNACIGRAFRIRSYH